MILWTLFITFFKIGLFTFGGGYAMIPLIQSEIERHGWLSAEELINFIAVAESTPGPFAINIATYVGSEMGGTLGGAFFSFLGSVCATLGVVLPSFIVILIVAKCYEKFRKNKIVNGCMSGLKPAVIGLIGAAALSLGISAFFPNGISGSVFTSAEFYVSVGIFVLALVLSLKKAHPILIICLSALIGIVAGFLIGAIA